MCVLILIILEYIYILFYKKIRMQFWSLNPYYTGIHLHRRITSPDALSLVLILIILEYIYINYNVTLAASVSVLILIILEYIYMMLLEQSLRRKCLNPYYTGIHLHSATYRWKIRGLLRLNPYYTGIHLHKSRKNLLQSCQSS